MGYFGNSKRLLSGDDHDDAACFREYYVTSFFVMLLKVDMRSGATQDVRVFFSVDFNKRHKYYYTSFTCLLPPIVAEHTHAHDAYTYVMFTVRERNYLFFLIRFLRASIIFI